MFKVTTKLKLVKTKIKEWVKDNRTNIQNLVHDAKVKLEATQVRLAGDIYNTSLLEEEAALLKEYKWACYVETVDMKQKAEDDWLLLGDRCSKYFHELMKAKHN